MTFSDGGSIKVFGALDSPSAPIDEVHFADGTIWNRATIKSLAWMMGTSGANAIYGTSSAEKIDGAGGNDYVNGGGGNDIIRFGSGYGHLEIDETDTASSPSNTLQFATGISPQGVVITQSGTDLLLTDGVSGDQVKLDAQLSSTQRGVQYVTFADGTKWDRGYLSGSQVSGTTGSDTLSGGSGADTIDGKGGADSVTGGGGADRYAYNSGYGALTIHNVSTADTGAHAELDLGGSIGPQDLWFVQNGSDLVVSHLGTSDNITVTDWFGSDATAKLSEIKLSNGLEIDSQVNSLISAMATFANDNPTFNPATATTMPADSTLQTAIAASWHS